ncbi:MAG: hypothetical protein R2707_18565 [Acidimicrobiales bacterium]
MQTIESTVSTRVRTRWIRQPGWDALMAFAWVPFAAAALAWSGQTDRLEWLVAATLVFSVSHQPLTMPLVYADPHVRTSRPVIFGLSPFIVMSLVLIGLQLDPVVIAVVAGVWNAGHTLQQRYGITRIYGRKVGQGDGTVEHRLLWSMLVLALLVAAADSATPDRIASAGLGGRNQRGLDILTNAAPVARYLAPLMGVVVAVLVVQWLRQELAADQVNPAKWLYLGSTAGLIGLTMVSPLAGFVGYVGSHAAEYYLIVHNHLADRYPDAVTDGGAPLGRAVRSRPGPLGLMAAYAVGIAVFIWAVRSFGSYQVYAAVFLTLGALHLFYDGLIWKLRRPEVARGFQIPASS